MKKLIIYLMNRELRAAERGVIKNRSYSVVAAAYKNQVRAYESAILFLNA